jgi:hypothetical protein
MPLAAADPPFPDSALRGCVARSDAGRMHSTAIALLAGVLIHATLVEAQTPSRKSHEEIQASFDQHKGDFDYLLGDWEFIANNQQWGKAHGVWSAVRLAEGQILDEYRIVGDKGETYYVTTTLRAWNATLERWELVGMDSGNGLQDIGTAKKVGSEMHLEQRLGVMSKEPSLWRIRYYDIQPTRFSWTADRSTDEGRTWTKAFHTIEARRLGPARSLPALAKPPSAATK